VPAGAGRPKSQAAKAQEARPAKSHKPKDEGSSRYQVEIGGQVIEGVVKPPRRSRSERNGNGNGAAAKKTAVKAAEPVSKTSRKKK
jgi:hypothetical protein